jgi:hypothetical protein
MLEEVSEMLSSLRFRVINNGIAAFKNKIRCDQYNWANRACGEVVSNNIHAAINRLLPQYGAQ